MEMAGGIETHPRRTPATATNNIPDELRLVTFVTRHDLAGGIRRCSGCRQASVTQ